MNLSTGVKNSRKYRKRKKEPVTQEFKNSYLNVPTSYYASKFKRKSAYLKGASSFQYFLILYGTYGLGLCDFFLLLSLKNDVNVPSKSKTQKKLTEK
jgi:hypothetical protein